MQVGVLFDLKILYVKWKPQYGELQWPHRWPKKTQWIIRMNIFLIHLLYNLWWRSLVHPVPPHINTFLILHHESSSPRLLHLFLCSLILCTIVGYLLFPLTILKWVTLVRCLFSPWKSASPLRRRYIMCKAKDFWKKVASRVWPDVVKDYYNVNLFHC